MKKALLTMIAVTALGCGTMPAQQGGTINTLSVNPRENQELTNSTGTETGRPSEAVPGSEKEPNGLVPVTSDMVGSGSNGNTNQKQSTEKAANASSQANPPEPKSSAQKTDSGSRPPQQ
jgi:hypothetical protein